MKIRENARRNPAITGWRGRNEHDYIAGSFVHSTRATNEIQDGIGATVETVQSRPVNHSDDRYLTALVFLYEQIDVRVLHQFRQCGCGWHREPGPPLDPRP